MLRGGRRCRGKGLGGRLGGAAGCQQLQSEDEDITRILLRQRQVNGVQLQEDRKVRCRKPHSQM